MDCIVLGDGWTGPWLARELQVAGASVHYCRLHSAAPDSDRGPDISAVYVGNGELRTRAELSFGKEIISQLWDVSRANFQRAEDFFKSSLLPHRLDSALWFGPDSKPVENSPALLFQQSALTSWLEADVLRRGGQIETIDDISALNRASTFEYEVKGHRGGSEKAMRATSLFISTESFPRSLVRGLESIWLPITLNRFTFKSPKSLGAVSLFHGGIDYCWQKDPGTATVGSYRNLFEDRAFGMRRGWVDAVSENAVTSFFAKQGWIADGALYKASFIESLSCDGLPLAGQLSAYPGVFLLSGFAARTANFFFELSHCLAAAFTGQATPPILGLLSPKRFA